MGGEKLLKLRSSGVPLGITPAKARAILARGFHRHEVCESNISELAVAHAFVKMFVANFGAPEDALSWEHFFDHYIPQEPVNRNNSAPIHDTYLHKLFAEYGGEPRRKDREHLRYRKTISSYSESLVFPEAPWSQAERDATAQYAASMDKSLLFDKGDLKRVVKRKKKVTILDKEASDKPPALAKKATRKQRKKARRAKIVVDIDDALSASTQSTAVSSVAYSMKSGDDSDLGSGFASELSSCCDGNSVASEFSVTDLTEVPKKMKFKDIAETYFAKIGTRFKDLENDVIYRVVRVSRVDQEVAGKERNLVIDKLCFRYINDELDLSDLTDPEDIEYSLCSEMMEGDWVKWLDD